MMSTCKDCVHAKVCKDYLAYKLDKALDGIDGSEKPICELFKDRAKFIELPCKLGDKVFYFDTAGRIYKQTIFQFVYSGTGLKLDSEVMFDSKLIGKRFFLSREEAEQALKREERENDKP